MWRISGMYSHTRELQKTNGRCEFGNRFHQEDEEEIGQPQSGKLYIKEVMSDIGLQKGDWDNRNL